MKTSHKSKEICKYRTLEKYSNTFYKNKQNINPACAYQAQAIAITKLATNKAICLKSKKIAESKIYF